MHHRASLPVLAFVVLTCGGFCDRNSAQEPTEETPQESPKEEPSHASLRLGYADSGLCFGNSRRWNGLRMNIKDRDCELVRGVNLTFWSPSDHPVERVEGLALGLAPWAGTQRGASLGLLVAGAESSIGWLQAGGLATVSQGKLLGISAASLAVVAEEGMRGLQLAGLAVVSQGDNHGISAAGLAAVTEGDLRGVGVAGLAVVTENAKGLCAAGLAVVANERFTGLGVAGLAVSTGDMGFKKLWPVGKPDEGDTSATGVMLAGYRVQSNHITGLSAAGLVVRTHDLDGLAVSAFNAVSGRQRGLSIGVVNHAHTLQGLQIGVLNHVATNPFWLRWLPLFNFQF
jgi:hypothetical protein